MKKSIFIIASLLLWLAPISSRADSPDSPEDMRKEYKQQEKMTKERRKATEKSLNQKATKEARKEAKNLAKEGWTVTPGTLPLEKQLDRAYLMQYEMTDLDTPKYVWGQAMSVGGSYDAALMQATELAKLNLIGQIESEITMMVDNSVANDQMSADDAASLVRTVASSKNTISKKLGRIRPVVTAYRPVRSGNKEVMVRIGYDLSLALKATKEALRQELKGSAGDISEKLDSIIPNE